MPNSQPEDRSLRSPFDILYDLRREVDRLLGGFPTAGGEPEEAGRFPAEVEEREGEVRIVIETPGIQPNDLDVRVEGDQLIVSGERRSRRDTSGDEGSYRLREIRYGRFERSFPLPPGTRPDDVKARCEEGVLTITVPKARAAGSRKIPVEGAISASSRQAGGQSREGAPGQVGTAGREARSRQAGSPERETRPRQGGSRGREAPPGPAGGSEAQDQPRQAARSRDDAGSGEVAGNSE